MRAVGAVALICGNGLTLDVCADQPLMLARWHPQRPLAWPLTTPGDPSTPLIQSLPALMDALSTKYVSRARTDFDKLNAVLSQIGVNGDSLASSEATALARGRLAFQTRHFISVAFAQFQSQLERVPLNSWRWTRWLAELRRPLRCVVSFNYDLLLEDAVAAGGLVVHQIQLEAADKPVGIPVFKPHGSVDFEVDPRALSIRVQYPLTGLAVVDCNFPIVRVPRTRLMEPRLFADVVLPTETSPLTRVQWIQPGYAFVRRQLAAVDRLVIAGLSYWPPDRPEIDSLIDASRRDCVICIANPSPPPSLVSSVQRRGRRVEIWRDGPEPL